MSILYFKGRIEFYLYNSVNQQKAITIAVASEVHSVHPKGTLHERVYSCVSVGGEILNLDGWTYVFIVRIIIYSIAGAWAIPGNGGILAIRDTGKFPCRPIQFIRFRPIHL